MTNPDPRVDEVEALATHEEVIGRLYDAYAEKFPEYQEFWSDLADEERGHAEWLRKFRRRVELGQAEFNEGRFRIRPIEKSIEYINGYAYKARHEDMTVLYALTTAADIEGALMEKDFLSIYETDNEDLKETLDWLVEATREHKRKIDDLIAEVRQSGELSFG